MMKNKSKSVFLHGRSHKGEKEREGEAPEEISPSKEGKGKKKKGQRSYCFAEINHLEIGEEGDKAR